MIIKFDAIEKLVQLNDSKDCIHLKIDNPKLYYSVLRAIEQEDDTQIQIYSESYDQLDIHNQFDFVGNPLVNNDINEQYILKIRKRFLEQMNPLQRENFQEISQKVAEMVEQQLFFTDIPLTIDFEADPNVLLNAYNLRIEPDALNNPYGIICLVMKLHSIFNPHSILCLSDLANYFDRDELMKLEKECFVAKVKMILIN